MPPLVAAFNHYHYTEFFNKFLERCFKDVLIIFDTSASMDTFDVDSKFKPFLRRLVDDSRLGVSAKGSNIAIMSFGEKATIHLPFREHYDKGVYYEVINDINSLLLRVLRAKTKTFLALRKANEVYVNCKLYFSNRSFQ